MKTLSDFLNQYYSNLELKVVDQAELEKRILNQSSRYDVNVPTPSGVNCWAWEELRLARYIAKYSKNLTDQNKYVLLLDYLKENPSHRLDTNPQHGYLFKNCIVFEVSEAEREQHKALIAEEITKLYQEEVDQLNQTMLNDEATALKYAKAELAKYEYQLAQANKPNLSQFKNQAIVKNELLKTLSGVEEISFQEVKENCSIKDNALITASLEQLGFVKGKNSEGKNVWIKETK